MVDRRRFLLTLSGMGFGTTLLPGVLWALADGKPELTEGMIGFQSEGAAIEFRDIKLKQLK